MRFKLTLIFPTLGAHVTGQMDDIVNLKELCKKYSIWIHLSGDNLSGLALAKYNIEVRINSFKKKILINIFYSHF